MSQETSQSRCEATFDEDLHCGTALTEVGKIMGSTETRVFGSSPLSISDSAPLCSPTLRNPANKLWTRTTQREAYIRHMRNWASNHDSSAYFHGSISILPRGTFPGEVFQLGKSVNCLLTSLFAGDAPRVIVIRLFQSQRYGGNAQRRRARDDPGSTKSSAAASETLLDGYESHHEKIRTHRKQPAMPYHLVIRNGSGWVPARQFFDKYYFAYRAKLDAQAASQHLVGRKSSTVFQRPARTISNADGHSFNNTNTNAGAHALSDRTNWSALGSIQSKQAEVLSSAKDTITISPLFYPFLRLPIEIQDEILYQAVGYTRSIDLTRTRQSPDVRSSSEYSITVSQLFRISKAINARMVAHVLRSTLFHFGVTGFTTFLWQLGPTNRSNLQHLAFHFGSTSLLHCIRWIAPDQIYELFEPPVHTNPANLTYFWRCQLQDLMKELHLSTLTVDIGDVPPADVPMLVRILKTAMGRVDRVWIVDESARIGHAVDRFTEGLLTVPNDLAELTWRSLTLSYHSNYRHQRWHMRQIWTPHDVDVRPLLNVCMDKDKAFFDS